MPAIEIPYQRRTTERFLDLGCFDFSENVNNWNFPVGFRVWQGLESIDVFSGIQIDGFLARTEPYGSIFNDFHYLVVSASVFGLLTLPLGGPKTSSECPKSP